LQIAYLTNIATDRSKAGGHVHVTQVANILLSRGHKLYTNLPDESEKFIRLNKKEFFKRGKEIEVFYIRIHGHQGNEELTELRKANNNAPCIWEINAPNAEVSTRGYSQKKISTFRKRRKKLASMVDAALCVSLEMEEYAIKELGIKKTIVVPNGSDPEMFGPHKRRSDSLDNSKFRVLWSGSTDPKYTWQAFNLVEEIANRIKNIDENILFIVTAEGESNSNIKYIGRVPYYDMPGIMASCNVGLCLYNEINFYDKFYFSPLKLFDYMASGLPIIGNNLGQIKVVIEENENGLLVNGDVDDIIEKVIYLKQNEDIAATMGNKGREAIINKYNWQRVVSEIEKMIVELIDKKGSGKNSESNLGIWSKMKEMVKGIVKD